MNTFESVVRDVAGRHSKKISQLVVDQKEHEVNAKTINGKNFKVSFVGQRRRF